jgi:hypothetical protein
VLRFLKVIGQDDVAKPLIAWLEAEAESEGSRLPHTLAAYWRKGIEPEITANGVNQGTGTQLEE